MAQSVRVWAGWNGKCRHCVHMSSTACNRAELISFAHNANQFQDWVDMIFCNASSARLAVDFTVPLEIPVASAISVSVRLP